MTQISAKSAENSVLTQWLKSDLFKQIVSGVVVFILTTSPWYIYQWLKQLSSPSLAKLFCSSISLLIVFVFLSGFLLFQRHKIQKKLDDINDDPLTIEPQFPRFLFSKKTNQFYCPACYAKGIRAWITTSYIRSQNQRRYKCVNCGFPENFDNMF